MTHQNHLNASDIKRIIKYQYDIEYPVALIHLSFNHTVNRSLVVLQDQCKYLTWRENRQNIRKWQGAFCTRFYFTVTSDLIRHMIFPRRASLLSGLTTIWSQISLLLKNLWRYHWQSACFLAYCPSFRDFFKPLYLVFLESMFYKKTKVAIL